MLYVKTESPELMTRREGARIDEALYLLSRKYGRVLLLLDRFGGDPLAQSIAGIEGPLPASLPLDDAMFAADLDSAPLLIELLHAVPEHYKILQRSIALSQEQSVRATGLYPVCAWLFGDAPLGRMRRELTKRLDARYPSHQVFFRYFDPRVMSQLAAILVPTNEANQEAPNSSFSELLGPVATWCCLDRHGRLAQHHNTSTVNKNFIFHLRFDVETSGAIDRIETVNLALDELDGRYWLRALRDDGAIDQHLQVALRCGLEDQDDRVAYAWRAAGYGGTFLEQPELQNVIEEALGCGVPLEYLLQERLPTII